MFLQTVYCLYCHLSKSLAWTVAMATYPAPPSAVTPTEFIFHTEGRVTILQYEPGHLLKIVYLFPLNLRHDLQAVSDLLHAQISTLLPFLIHLISGFLRIVYLAQGVLLQLSPQPGTF